MKKIESLSITTHAVSPFRTGAAFALLVSCLAEGLFYSLVSPSGSFAMLGRVLALFISLYVIFQLALGLRPKSVRPFATKDVITLILITTAFVIIEWIGRILGLSVAAYADRFPLFEELSHEGIIFAVPFAAGSIVVQAVLGLHMALVYSLALTIITILYTPEPIIAALYVLVTCLVAALSLSRVRSRMIFMRVGFSIALLSVAFAFISIIVEGPLPLADALVRVLGGGTGGLLCALLSAGILPLVEYLGGYVTDMRLIEMATLDHPLLKELSIQAPGTWNHSMVMGMMGEVAADSIGANAVLARVGAYFHDIGKLKKPLYFVENQTPGENRHDKLSPSMSALIIRSHVKDGLELARKHTLPVGIMDMIEQHHGTSPIEYFYDKAVKEAQAEGKEVDRSHYCYPGPRPQTREAGILMLADGIEAASRTMTEPTADRVQGMVQKMINKVFSSGQLNECELTLADLHQIAKCFTRVLSGIYHQRVSYSEPVEKGRVKSAEIAQIAPDGETLSDHLPKEMSDVPASANDPKAEGLKRLGMEASSS